MSSSCTTTSILEKGCGDTSEEQYHHSAVIFLHLYLLHFSLHFLLYFFLFDKTSINKQNKTKQNTSATELMMVGEMCRLTFCRSHLLQALPYQAPLQMQALLREGTVPSCSFH